MKKILSIKIKHVIDDNPDTSYLGEYSNHRAKFSFDREFLHDINRGEYKYFNPCINPLQGKTQKEKKDLFLQAKRDYERMESLNNGNWCYIGIRAEAEININGVIQYITSGGLYGIESDSGRDYIEEVEKEELKDLKDQLKELGFSEKAINKTEVIEVG
jgi:hypothetical protein